MPQSGSPHTNIAVLGGGAAGLMAAVCAARESCGRFSVTVIEKEQRVGKKLLTTGNGRCNLSNESIKRTDYFGSFSRVADTFFQAYSCDVVRKLFKTLGLFSRVDECGRVYPCSNAASSVLDVLRINMQNYGVTEVCQTDITSVVQNKDGIFLLKDSGGSAVMTADSLIITTGGKASLKNAQEQAGYGLVKNLSHTTTPLFPSLAPVAVESGVLRSLKGQRVFCSISLRAGNKMIANEHGELQFTENALSGICVFQLSRHINEYFAHCSGGQKTEKPVLCVDILPDINTTELFEELNHRCKEYNPQLEDLLTGILSKRLAFAVIKECGLAPFSRPSSDIGKNGLSKLCHFIKNWEFTPCSPSQMKHAQVTAGGIPAKEVNLQAMSSKLHKGLYFAGEILDMDGKCGGYNLHWAWVSGMLAGTNAAADLKGEQ